jgi:carbonic anhydrase/acetyltransferase-like protein (isoleucine patch superfamily)
MPKTLLRRISNRALGLLARFAPGARSVRPFLHRLRGVKIGRNVWIGDDVYLENEYPEGIELHDGAQICLRSIVLAHTHGPGRVVIGRNAFIGTGSLLSASTGKVLRVGDGAVVSAYTVVSADVPAQAFIAPPKPGLVARATVPLTDEVSFDTFVRGLRPWRH